MSRIYVSCEAPPCAATFCPSIGRVLVRCAAIGCFASFDFRRVAGRQCNSALVHGAAAEKAEPVACTATLPPDRYLLCVVANNRARVAYNVHYFMYVMCGVQFALVPVPGVVIKYGRLVPCCGIYVRSAAIAASYSSITFGSSWSAQDNV